MNKRLAEQILHSILIGVVLLSASCVKENESMLISGTWAQVDENMMTRHIVSFVSGTYSSSEADNAYLVAEHSVWNCLEKDFKSKVSVRYSVSDDVITVSGKIMRASADGETMTLDGHNYVRIDSFKEGFYRDIILSDNKVECNFSGGDHSVSYTLQNFGSAVPSPSCDATWISDMVCSGSSVSFKVAPSTESREAIITLSYYGLKDKTIVVYQKAAKRITSTPAIVYANYSAQNKSISVSVTNGASGLSFQAKSTQTWISDVAVSGTTIVFALLENNSGKEREGSVVVSYSGADDLEIPVFQEYNAPAIYLNNTTFTLSPDAGTYTTGYSIDYPRAGKSISCSSKPSWVNSVSFSGDHITFDVAANTGSGNRSGTIYLSYNDAPQASINLTQTSSTLSVSASSWTAPVSGGVTTVNVTSNSAWEVSCNSDWISISKTAVSGNVTTLSITAALNNSGQARTATCQIKTAKNTRTFTINQDTETLTLGSSSWGPAFGSNSYNLGITTAGDWVVSSNQDWLTVSKTTGAGSGSVTLNVTANDEKGATARMAAVTVRNTTYNLSSTLTVTQSAFVPSMSVSSTSLSGSYSASSSTTTVTSNVSWTATSNVDWLSVSPASKTINQQSVSTSVTLTVNANNTTSSRTATVTFVNGQYGLSRTIQYTQSAASEASLSVPSSITLYSDASTSPLNISSNIPWQVKSDQPWLSFSPSSGSGDKSIDVNATINETGGDRNATITVYNTDYNCYRSVSVVQKDFSLSISTSSWTTYSATSQDVSVTSTGNWEVESDSSWLTVNKTSGSGNGSFTMRTAEIPSSTSSRTGTITVKNSSFGVAKAITVTQIKPSLTIDQTYWTANCGVKSSPSIYITSNVDWTVSSNATWLSLSKSSGVSGSSAIVLTVTGNNSSSSRTATVTVSNASYGISKTISITQYGYTKGAISLSYISLDLGIPIDRTGTYSFVIKGWTSNGHSLLGINASSDSNDWRFFKSGSSYYFDWGSQRIQYSYSTSITGSYRKFVLSNYSMKYYSSDTTTSTTWTKSGTAQNSVPSTTQTIILGHSSESLTFKSLTITNSSGTTTHNFVGAKSNGTAGVFDTITGSFIAGGSYVSL